MVRTSEYQRDIALAAKVNSPKYLIAGDQAAAKSAFANKLIIISTFNHDDVGKNFVKTGGVRYPKDSFCIDYASNVYFIQYRDLNLFFLKNMLKNHY